MNLCGKCKNPVNPQDGICCTGPCHKWRHYECLTNLTETQIEELKCGINTIRCPCPDCDKSKTLNKSEEAALNHNKSATSGHGSPLSPTRSKRSDSSNPSSRPGSPSKRNGTAANGNGSPTKRNESSTNKLASSYKTEEDRSVLEMELTVSNLKNEIGDIMEKCKNIKNCANALEECKKSISEFCSKLGDVSKRLDSFEESHAKFKDELKERENTFRSSAMSTSGQTGGQRERPCYCPADINRVPK